MEAQVSKAQYDKLLAAHEALQYQFAQLLKLVKGFKSERFEPTQAASQQATLFDGELSLASVSTEPPTKQVSYERKQAAPRTQVRKLPDHLPVEEHILEPEADVTGLKCIGQEVTDTLDYLPGRLVIIRRIRPKYVMPLAQGDQSADSDQSVKVLIAELPSRPIERGLAEPGLLAQICVDKYIDHLPLYRQAKRFERDYGWPVACSTLGDWFSAVCKLLKPLYDKTGELVIDGDYLQVDESSLKVLDREKKGDTHLGYMWVYRNPMSGLIYFDYRRGRGSAGVNELLKNFAGYLQTDGYKVYEQFLRTRPSVIGVGCTAHIRRKFVDALPTHEAKAAHVLTEVQILYRVEAHCRKKARTAAERLALRQRISKPVYDRLLAWVNSERANNLSKGAYGKALSYAANQLPKLAAIFEDGRIELDNNLIENSIRPLALGRKNYLFAGSHEGARRAAMMYSFFGTCVKLGVNPREWLADVLSRISDHPRLQLEELLPHRWRKAEG